MSSGAGTAEPAAAAVVFGTQLPLARQYVELLGTWGIERGLLGPREVTRLWDRHVLNCAVAQSLLAPGQRVLDVGSGAGLPGLALALARPDIEVVLLEPLLRRVRFLDDVVADLRLGDRVVVHRGRAEDGAVRRELGRFPVVTARALAPLERLVGWCLPLTAADGRILAFKGAQAGAEVQQAGPVLRRLRLRAEIRTLGGDGPGAGGSDDATTVTVLHRVPG